jgi:hypothetical protein
MPNPVNRYQGALGLDAGSLYIGGTQVTVTADELNTLDASAVGGQRKVKTIAITAAANTDENSTGWSLPAKAIVHNVFLDVTTAEATATTKTIDVGTLSTDSGDANGYFAAVSTATLGLVKGTLLNTGQTLGALLSVDEDGAGALVPEADITMGGKEITWTAGEAQTEFAGTIVIEYTEIV